MICFMKYALLNNQFVIATPHKKGAICPLCKSPLIAKCGDVRVHHWSHKKGCICDEWREADCEWRHRWLELFSHCEVEPIIEKNGSKHFADIRTKNGTTILLRRGKVNPSELQLMEMFFDGLVWIVDLSRNRKAASELTKGLRCGTLRQAFRNAYRTIGGQAECFPDVWSRCRYPVVFDCSGEAMTDQLISGYLWCLLPCEENSRSDDRFVLRYRKAKLVRMLTDRGTITPRQIQEMVSQLNDQISRMKEL